jgi:hypothetical protein
MEAVGAGALAVSIRPDAHRPGGGPDMPFVLTGGRPGSGLAGEPAPRESVDPG